VALIFTHCSFVSGAFERKVVKGMFGGIAVNE
jgi:hypothetical protein